MRHLWAKLQGGLAIRPPGQRSEGARACWTARLGSGGPYVGTDGHAQLGLDSRGCCRKKGSERKGGPRVTEVVTMAWLTSPSLR